jgi:hypothetical protein
MILLPLRFRIVSAIAAILIAFMTYVILLNSKEKIDYQKLSGSIVYLDKQFGEYPNRNLGKYRYLKLNTYPYIFEIYSDEQSSRIDSLKIGEIVDVYYYEINNTHSEQINRFLQYLEKGDKIFFKRGNSNNIAGFVVMGLSVLLIVGSFVLYKKGKMLF